MTLAEIDLVLTDTPPAGTMEVIAASLARHNAPYAGPAILHVLAVPLTDPDTGAVVGGLWGRTLYSWLCIQLLFVPEAMRGSGVGARLVRMAEREAIARRCLGMFVDTFSFQARGFYERQGFEHYGTLEDCPPGHACHSLRKRFTPTPSA